MARVSVRFCVQRLGCLTYSKFLPIHPSIYPSIFGGGLRGHSLSRVTQPCPGGIGTNARATSAGSSLWKSSGSTPSFSHVTKLLTPSLTVRPATKQSCSLGRCPKLIVTINNGRNVDRLVSWELHRLLSPLFLHQVTLVQRLQYYRRHTGPPSFSHSETRPQGT